MKKIVIFEVEGGADKGFDGHRKDTMPIVQALKEKNIDAEVIFYRNEWKDDIFEYCKDRFDGYIPRINPGYINSGEKKFFDLLRKLADYGLIAMSHPDVVINFGAKDVLVKLRDTELVPDDTYVYYTEKDFNDNFPVQLSYGTRVLKQNIGSGGSGIWRVEIEDTRDFSPGENLPANTKIKCSEAVDNHVEHRQLGEFMDFYKHYLTGTNGMIVDTPFMPRIVEGEIRILLIGKEPIFVVHKKPVQKKHAFSATLFSGAYYTYYKPKAYQELIDVFSKHFPIIEKKMGNFPIPLIWTADFMLDTDENGADKYVLGEINCSCVGFTSHLQEGIQEKIAIEVEKRLQGK